MIKEKSEENYFVSSVSGLTATTSASISFPAFSSMCKTLAAFFLKRLQMTPTDTPTTIA